MVTEDITAPRLSEDKVQYAIYSINEDVTTLHRMQMEGWIDPKSEVLLVQASKLLQQAVKISNSK